MNADREPEVPFEPPTDEELAQAQALADALQRQRFTAAVPEDVFAAARLLQSSLPEKGNDASAWQLSAEAQARVLQEALTGARSPAQPTPRAKRWLWGFAALPTALAGLWLGIQATETNSERATAMAPATQAAGKRAASDRAESKRAASEHPAIPEPSLALLQAQAAWIRRPDERAPFDQGMQQYRQQVYVALGER